MNICRDCRFVKLNSKFTDASRQIQHAICEHPAAHDVDKVTGVEKKQFCTTMRIFVCGDEGKHFKPADREAQ